MTAVLFVLVTTFLASAVEAIEMVTIVLGVGATRGWRATIVGAVAGFGVLAVIVLIAGLALSRVPIGPLRLIVGALLLVFGLQWFRKGVTRVDRPWARLDSLCPRLQGRRSRRSRGCIHRRLVRRQHQSAGCGGHRRRLGRCRDRRDRADPAASRDQDPPQPIAARGRNPSHNIRYFLVARRPGRRVAGRRWRHPRPAGALPRHRRHIHHHRAPAGARVQPGGLTMRLIWSWIAGFGLFWYHFIIGDDWTVAAAVAAGLILTALFVSARINAWWIVPLIVIAMLGLSLRRTSKT